MISLNNLTQLKVKKLELVEVLALEKVRHLEEASKVKNLDQVLLSKVLKVDKCLYTEDFLNEDLDL